MQRTLLPVFDYRFSMDEIRGYYPSLEDALSAGDYNLVATYAPDNSALKGCALILAGLVAPGLMILKEKPELDDFSLLCLAYGYWSVDCSEDAHDTLKRIAPTNKSHFEAARKLADLIHRPSINVFTISVALPIFAKEDDKARRPVHHYGQFTVKHVASQLAVNAYPEYKQTAPFDKFIESLPDDEKPAFIFSMTPQAILPLNYEKVKIPKIMWCHDTDIFLCRGYDNFQLNDINIVTTSQEHFELSHGLGTRVISNMMSDTMCTPLKSAELNLNKDIDVLCTGAALNKFHSEKSRFMFHLASLSDEFNIRIVEGHLPEAEYKALLSRSRFVPIVNRYAGVTSPRWGEALSAGAMLFYPEGTPFGELVPGAFPYRSDFIAEDIRNHLRAMRDTGNDQGSPYNMREIFPQILDAISILRDPREKQIERQLRFCTFSLLLKELHGRPPPQISARRRLNWYVPSVDSFLWGADLTKERMLSLGDNVDETSLSDDKDYANAALIYTQILMSFLNTPEEQDRYLQRRVELLESGIRRFPNSLLLRYNHIQWDFMLEHKHDQLVKKETIDKFEKLIVEFDSLEFDPVGSDIGIPYTTVHTDQAFPYYDYGQLMVKWLVKQKLPQYPAEEIPDPRSVILASAHAYIGWGKLLRCHQGDAYALREAIAHLDTSLIIYVDNLPVMELRFHALAKLFEITPKAEIAKRLIDAFFVYAEKFPAALLSDLYIVLPVMHSFDQTSSARELLSYWYRLYRTVRYAINMNPKPQLVKLMTIVHYRHLLPPYLIEKYEYWTNKATQVSAIPPHDQDIYVAFIYDDWLRLNNIRSTGTAMNRELLSAPEQISHLEEELETARNSLNAVLSSRGWRMLALWRFLRGQLNIFIRRVCFWTRR